MIKTEKSDKTDEEIEKEYWETHDPNEPPLRICSNMRGSPRSARLHYEGFEGGEHTDSSSELAEILNRIYQNGPVRELVVDPERNNPKTGKPFGVAVYFKR